MRPRVRWDSARAFSRRRRRASLRSRSGRSRRRRPPSPRRRSVSFPPRESSILLEIAPWAFDRYVSKEDFAYISFRHGQGRTSRPDSATTATRSTSTSRLTRTTAASSSPPRAPTDTTSGSPARSRSREASSGSAAWRTRAPSLNDLVNTTLGGMTRGEISHRRGDDDPRQHGDRSRTGSGASSAAAFVDPVGGLSRLFRGELGRVTFANPDDRFPTRFAVMRRPRVPAPRRGRAEPEPGHRVVSPVTTAIPSPARSRIRSTRSGSAIDLNRRAARSSRASRSGGSCEGGSSPIPRTRSDTSRASPRNTSTSTTPRRSSAREVLGAGVLSRYRVRSRD